MYIAQLVLIGATRRYLPGEPIPDFLDWPAQNRKALLSREWVKEIPDDKPAKKPRK